MSAATGTAVVGIDVAATRPSVAVALSCGRAARVDGWFEIPANSSSGLRALLDWVESRKPSVVAVGAPQALARRAARGGMLRACDQGLHRRGLPYHKVPARGEEPPVWMKTGMALFRGLERRGFERPDGSDLPAAFGRAAAVLEVHSYASFALMLREAQLAGSLAAERRLLRKTSGDGALLRLKLLRQARVDWDWWERYLDHRHIDALGAACTAWRYVQGAAAPLGDVGEGLLWLPVSAEFLREHVPLKHAG